MRLEMKKTYLFLIFAFVFISAAQFISATTYYPTTYSDNFSGYSTHIGITTYTFTPTANKHVYLSTTSNGGNDYFTAYHNNPLYQNMIGGNYTWNITYYFNSSSGYGQQMDYGFYNSTSVNADTLNVTDLFDTALVGTNGGSNALWCIRYNLRYASTNNLLYLDYGCTSSSSRIVVTGGNITFETKFNNTGFLASYIYVNGTLVNSTTTFYSQNMTWLNSTLYFGLATGNVNGYSGRQIAGTVTDSTISYNVKQNITISSLSPANDYNSQTADINFSGHVSSVNTLSNVSLYFNGSLNQTNSTGLNNTDYNFSIKNLIQGAYTWFLQACDTTGICANSSTLNVYYDTISPNISYLSGTTAAGNDSQDYISVNISANDSGSGLKNITTYLYNGSKILNKSVTNTTSPAFNNFSGLAYGTYYINATAYDNAGNVNSTATREITLLPINITLTAPVNNTNTSQANNTFNATVKDLSGSGIANVTLYIWYKNGTLLNKSQYTIAGSTGFGSGSDGAVTFTSSTKTYGNLVLGTDYEVSGSTLYLRVDKAFNFTDFTLGPGMTLAPYDPSNTGAAIYIQATGTVTINGTVESNFANAYNTVRGQYVNTTFNSPNGTITTPGTGKGGSGGGYSYNSTQSYYDLGGLQGYGYGGGGYGGGCSGSCEAYGGGALPGGSGITGGAACSISSSSGSCTGGDGNNSGGGGGGVYIGTTASGTSGTGAGTYGGSGTSGSLSGCSSSVDCEATGGGGAGGEAGYSGLNFYVFSKDIVYAGTINASGTPGGNGGNGGNGAGTSVDCSPGGNGAGGGGGGNGGNIKLYYSSSFVNSSVNFYFSGGAEGINGSAGSEGGGGTCGSVSQYDGQPGQPGTSGTKLVSSSVIYNTNASKSYIFSKDGTYLWSVQACNLNGNCVFSQSNYTLNYDSGIPKITINSPANNSYATASTKFNATVSDNVKVENVSIYIDGKLNQTNSTGLNNTNYVFTITGLSNAKHTWNIIACNLIGNCTNSSKYTITFDDIPPGINFVSPTDDGNYSRHYIRINVTANDSGSGLKNITINVYSNNALNNTNTSASSPFYWNVSKQSNSLPLVDGTYYINATAYDNAGNVNSTATRKIILDTTGPVITIYSPLAQNYGYNDSIPLNYSSIDAGVGTNESWYNIVYTNGTTVISNTTLSGNTTFSLPGGNHNFKITIYSNDSLGNLNSKSVTFGVTTSGPAITLNKPLNDSWLNYSTNITFNFTVTDTNPISTCILYSNFTGNWTQNESFTSVTSGTPVTAQKNLTQNFYMWNVWCNDSLNDANYALNNNTFGIDTVNPNVSITGISTTAGSQVFTFTSDVSDPHISYCTYTIYNSTGVAEPTNKNVTFACGVLTQASTTESLTLAPFTNTLSITGVDLAGNTNTSNKTFTINPAPTPTPPTGGPSGPTSDTYPTVALIPPKNVTKPYDNLDKSVIFAAINNYCGTLVTGLPTINYYTTCTLTNSDLIKIQGQLNESGMPLSISELTQWYEQYKLNSIFQTYSTSSEISKFNLTQSLVSNPMTVNPPDINTFILVPADHVLRYNLLASKNITKCDVTSQQFVQLKNGSKINPFSCVLLTNTTAQVRYNITDPVFHAGYKGQIVITSGKTSKDQENVYVNVLFNAYWLQYPVLGVPIWIVFIIGAIATAVIIYLVVRYVKKRKKK